MEAGLGSGAGRSLRASLAFLSCRWWHRWSPGAVQPESPGPTQLCPARTLAGPCPHQTPHMVDAEMVHGHKAVVRSGPWHTRGLRLWPGTIPTLSCPPVPRRGPLRLVQGVSGHTSCYICMNGFQNREQTAKRRGCLS